VIAVDTNILVYAHLERLDRHHAARAAIERLITRGKPWAIPWPCVHEFLAVVSNRKFHADAPTTRELLGVVDLWHQAPGLRFIGIGDEHWTHLRRLLERADVSGGQIHDARIAAVCEEASVTELWTADRDFSRFPGLRTHNPL
jgi:toxin-antitoxin system PIN domain toxin